MKKLQDIHVLATEPLIAPNRLKDELPVPPVLAAGIIEGRETVRRIIAGQDDRLLCVVGPCSIHDPVATLDYAERLVKLGRSLDHRLVVMMRVYFEKPRTTIGWKGLINDPGM
ncbi:MAG: 3-deoxy-7-phosphoheptulonate synthase, partial [Terriglobia bacterium]